MASACRCAPRRTAPTRSMAAASATSTPPAPRPIRPAAGVGTCTASISVARVCVFRWIDAAAAGARAGLGRDAWVEGGSFHLAMGPMWTKQRGNLRFRGWWRTRYRRDDYGVDDGARVVTLPPATRQRSASRSRSPAQRMTRSRRHRSPRRPSRARLPRRKEGTGAARACTAQAGGSAHLGASCGCDHRTRRRTSTCNEGGCGSRCRQSGGADGGGPPAAA